MTDRDRPADPRNRGGPDRGGQGESDPTRGGVPDPGNINTTRRPVDPRDNVSGFPGTGYAAGGVGNVAGAGFAPTTDPPPGAEIADEYENPSHFQERAELGQHTLREFKEAAEHRSGDVDINALMERIRPNMKVYDVNGKEIGKVEDVRMGDPQAATTEGQELETPDSWVDHLAEAFGAEEEPRLPGQFQRHALRVGYIKIDAKGLFAADRYALSNHVAEVEGDAVRLSVPEDRLAKAE